MKRILTHRSISLTLGSLTLGSLTLGSLTLGSLTLGSLTLGSLTLGSLTLISLPPEAHGDSSDSSDSSDSNHPSRVTQAEQIDREVRPQAGPPTREQVARESHVSHPSREQRDACADCHPEVVEGFKQTFMSRALAYPSPAEVIEDFSGTSSVVIHPKTRVGYRAFIDDEGRWWQEEFDPQGDYKRRVEIKYLIGSGNNTRSYIGEIGGELVELPLTWYSATEERAGLWDMSPGYQREDHFRFDRPVKSDCLFCHNDLSPSVDGRLARFPERLPPGITCARCHGDGAAHIEARLEGREWSGQPDPTILNPAHLKPGRQQQICEQCHLSGDARALLPGKRWDTYDPRTPLEDHARIYAFTAQDSAARGEAAQDSAQDSAQGSVSGVTFGIASHAERTALSACAQGSRPLTCTSCHDPHAPDTRDSYQRACLSCHASEVSEAFGASRSHHHVQTQPESLPQATQRATQRATRRATQRVTQRAQALDHLREAPACGREHTEDSSQAHSRVDQTTGGEPACFSCHMRSSGTSDIPHVKMTDHWVRKRPEETPVIERSGTLKSLLPKLRPELHQHSEGLLGLAYAELVLFVGRNDLISEAIPRLAKAARENPNWPELWSALAEVSARVGDRVAALAAYQRYAGLRPNDEYHRLREASTLSVIGERDRAEQLLRALVEQRPSNYRALELLGSLALQRGDREAASRWYDEAARQGPHEHSVAHNQGLLALISGDFTEARARFEEGIKLDGVSREGPFYLGLLSSAQGQHDTAVSRYRESLKRDPRFGQAHRQLTRSLLTLKRFDETVEAASAWVGADASSADAHLWLAQALDYAGRYHEAYSTLERAQRSIQDPRLAQALEVARSRLSRGPVPASPLSPQ